ncbi:hypothetical protein N8I71_06880 [Roseibacterium sp. SDUM158016]|nr:hypothetical protein [Roseibacterium sp. SDUM158016]MCU4652550.1 hypothetical protein [Roseibacterium sp. SDUM158016]
MRTTSMETFAHTPEMRARVAAARAEVARHFWRSLAGLFRRA